jgi:hypothetical protein
MTVKFGLLALLEAHLAKAMTSPRSRRPGVPSPSLRKAP